MYIYFCVTILFYISYVTASYSLCGDWQTFREEKCFRILDVEKLVTFDDALKSCSQIDSEILTIHSKEEQDFMSEYLFKTHKLANDVWIGLRNTSGHFEWTDSSNNQYTNWRTGDPIIKPDYNCVQVESHTSQWANELCNKNNLVVCQKIITCSDLSKQVLELNGRLNKMEDETKTRLREILSHYHTFTDVDGKNKAFFIPVDAVRKGYTFDDSVKLCNNFNSTLIEIESKEKQNILESFLKQSRIDFNYFAYFWINVERNSSGKWKWLKSDKEFTFTNWATDNPVSNSDYNNIFVHTYSTETFGKWVNVPKTDKYHVICEHTFEF